MIVPESFRVTGPVGHRLATTHADGNNGLFMIPAGAHGGALQCVASDGMGWEHVSVSTPRRTPTWSEMCHVRSLFWHPDEVVMQLHPAEADYVNMHEHCLHLWRPNTDGVLIPLPPVNMV